MRALLVLLACALVTACGGISDSDVEEALERQWESDPRAMADAYGIAIPGMEKGAVRGTAQALQSLREATQDYGYAGDVVADAAAAAAGGMISEGGKIASEFGIEGSDEFSEAVGIVNATDWTVSNIEIISERSSGDNHLAKVRYDLSAKVNGKMQVLQEDIAHAVRLADLDGDLTVVMPRPEPAE